MEFLGRRLFTAMDPPKEAREMPLEPLAIACPAPERSPYASAADPVYDYGITVLLRPVRHMEGRGRY